MVWSASCGSGSPARIASAGRARLPIDGGALPVRVALRREPAHGHAKTLRVAEPGGAVRIGRLHGLCHEMHGIGAAGLELRQVEALEDVEDLHEMDAARARRRHRDDLLPAIGSPHGRPDHRPVRGEVADRHDAAGAADGGGDFFSDRSRVEGVRAPRVRSPPASRRGRAGSAARRRRTVFRR